MIVLIQICQICSFLFHFCTLELMKYFSGFYFICWMFVITPLGPILRLFTIHTYLSQPKVTLYHFTYKTLIIVHSHFLSAQLFIVVAQLTSVFARNLTRHRSGSSAENKNHSMHSHACHLAVGASNRLTSQ